MTVTNHYGVYVDSETPTTGVITNHEIMHLIDAMYYEDGIDLDFEEHLKECPNDDHDHCWESNGSETWLIGDWQKGADGLYEPDKDGQYGYSAIVGEVYTQVVWSKWTTKGELCSPCYPGQGNVGSKGDFLMFTMPPEYMGEKETENDTR